MNYTENERVRIDNHGFTTPMSGKNVVITAKPLTRKFNNIYEFIEILEHLNPTERYFSAKNLSSFGERLSEMYVLQKTQTIVGYDDAEHEVYVVSALQHKHPNGPTRNYAYFDTLTYRRVFR